MAMKFLIKANAVRYGAMLSFHLLRETVRHGYGKVFSWKPVPRPRCLDDPTLGTHGYLNLEDVRIHYVASGPKHKPLMLFVHGFPEFWYSWRNQIREFQKDYRCVAIDLRGYGESDKPSGIDNYTLPVLMSDIKQIIQALGYNSCILVSHDWGGIISWAFGKFFPNFVDRLIVMNAPPGSVFLKVLLKNKQQRKMSWYISAFQLPYLPELLMKVKDYDLLDELFGSERIERGYFSGGVQNPLTKEEISAYKYTCSQPGSLTPMFDYYRASVQRTRVVYDLKYVMPVLFIWGCRDRSLSEAIVDEVEKENPKICVKRVQEASHFVQFDRPDLTNTIMREWLAVNQKDK